MKEKQKNLYLLKTFCCWITCSPLTQSKILPLNMEIPDILLCDQFFPKFCFALNNSPSDEISPTERLILWSLEHVSHLKSYKYAATVTQSSFWCNCCNYVEFFFVLSSLFCLFTQLTPAPTPHVTWCLIWLCAHFAGEEMTCGSAPLSKPLINSDHIWPDHIWVCGEESGDGGGFLLSPNVKCAADVENVHKHRGCVQEGPELALLPQEVQVPQSMQTDAPDVLQLWREPFSTVCWAQPSKWRTPVGWINCSGKLGLRLPVRWSPWRRWWGRGELDPINNL